MSASELIGCPRCNHLNDPENEFCDYCGFNIAHYYANAKEVNASPNVAELYAFKNYPSRLQTYSNKDSVASQDFNTKKVRLKFKNFKHPKRWSFAAVALIFVIGGYTYGQFYYSKTITLNRISDEAVSGKMNDDDVVDHASQAASPKVIAEQFKANPSIVDQLKSELNRTGRTQDGVFTYQKTGTHFGIFPKYQIVVNNHEIETKTYSVKIKTKPYALIMLNGKITSYADSHGNYQLSHLTNEKITLSAKYNSSRGGIVTDPIKVTPVNDHQVVRLIKGQVSKKERGQQLLNKMYAEMQKVTNQGKQNRSLAKNFVDNKDNHYYQSITQLALSFHHPGFKATYSPLVTGFKQNGRNLYWVTYNLKYRFESDKRVHTQIFKTYAVIQRDINQHYKLVSITSDSSPIKDEYQNK